VAIACTAGIWKTGRGLGGVIGVYISLKLPGAGAEKRYFRDAKRLVCSRLDALALNAF